MNLITSPSSSPGRSFGCLPSPGAAATRLLDAFALAAGFCGRFSVRAAGLPAPPLTALLPLRLALVAGFAGLPAVAPAFRFGPPRFPPVADLRAADVEPALVFGGAPLSSAEGAFAGAASSPGVGFGAAAESLPPAGSSVAVGPSVPFGAAVGSMGEAGSLVRLSRSPWKFVAAVRV